MIYFKLNTFFKKAVAVTVISSLAACSNLDLAKRSKQDALNKSSEATNLFIQGSSLTKTASDVEVLDEIYVVGDAFDIDSRYKLPSFFNESIVFSQLDPVSYHEIISKTSTLIDSRIIFDSTATDYLSSLTSEEVEDVGDEETVSMQVDYTGNPFTGSNVAMSFEFTGTVENLFNSLTQRAGLFWSWKEDHVLIYRHETKTYAFDSSLEAGNFSANISTSTSSGNTDGGATSGGGGSTHSTGTSYTDTDGFSDLEALLGSIKSPDGKFILSRATGLVSITDIPDVHRRAAKIISSMNKKTNTVISLDVKIYEVVSNEDGSFGIDWTAVYKNADGLGLDLGSNISSTAPNFTISALSGAFGGTSAMVSLLDQQSDVSLVSNAVVRTTNGRSVPVQVADEEGYIASTTRDVDENGGISYTAESGSALSGYTLSLTPRVNSNNDITLIFAGDFSTVDIKDLPTSGEALQYPDKRFSTLNLRDVVGSGETVMLSGLVRDMSDAQTDSLIGENLWMAGGRKASNSRKAMTLILVTPYILDRHRS